MGKIPWTIFYLDTSSQIGGAERSLLDLLGHMDRSMFRPVVACPDGGPLGRKLREMGTEIFDTDFPGLRSPLRFLIGTLKLKNAVRNNGSSLVHGFSTLSAKHAMVLGKLLGIPSVVHVRDQFLSRSFFYHLWLSRSDRVIAISEAVRKALMTGPLLNHVELVYNGIDTDRFHPAIDRMKVRSQLGWSEETPIACMAGRFSFEKGVNTFLEACALVIQQMPEARFVMVGDVVFPENQPLKTAMIEKRDELMLRDRVAFIGEREDIENIMADMDVVVVPSTLEAFGRVAAEAGACGRPVVASAVGGLPEVVADGETGILVAPENPPAMADAIVKLLKDKGLRSRMGMKARERVCEFFDIRTTTHRIEQLYLSLVNSQTADTRRCAGD